MKGTISSAGCSRPYLNCEFEVRRGPAVCKSCALVEYLEQMLKNLVYFGSIGFDTPEIGPSNIFPRPKLGYWLSRNTLLLRSQKIKKYKNRYTQNYFCETHWKVRSPSWLSNCFLSSSAELLIFQCRPLAHRARAPRDSCHA